MSFSNPHSHPTFQNIKNKYTSLKEPHQNIINELEQAKECIWKKSIEHRLLSFVINLPRIPLIIVISVGPLLFLEGLAHNVAVFGISLLFFAYVSAPWAAKAISPMIKKRVLLRNQSALQPYETNASNAAQKLNIIKKAYDAEWVSTCESFSSYPPDWQDRCAKVKSRDRNHCTECGYPSGFQRRSRELHVHHVTPISEGGTNELNNLITLCHICHRKIDSNHHGVRRINKSRPRRRYFL